MRHLWFSLFAIGVAAVAAMTATTALLNTPVRQQPAVVTQNAQPAETPAPPASGKPATADEDEPAAVGQPKAGPADAGKAGGADAANPDEEVDKDPYEGIAPEELPPDLQYSADSSVSFPTNI